MAWTWDHYGETTTAWQREAKDPLAHFILTVDRVFYTSAVALAISIIIVLLD